MNTTSNMGPINEIIVMVTNAVRKSPAGSAKFTNTKMGEEAFDKWQSMLLSSAEIISKAWYAEGDLCDKAITAFDNIFKIGVMPLDQL